MDRFIEGLRVIEGWAAADCFYFPSGGRESQALDGDVPFPPLDELDFFPTVIDHRLQQGTTTRTGTLFPLYS